MHSQRLCAETSKDPYTFKQNNRLQLQNNNLSAAGAPWKKKMKKKKDSPYSLELSQEWLPGLLGSCAHFTAMHESVEKMYSPAADQSGVNPTLNRKWSHYTATLVEVCPFIKSVSRDTVLLVLHLLIGNILLPLNHTNIHPIVHLLGYTLHRDHSNDYVSFVQLQKT